MKREKWLKATLIILIVIILTGIIWTNLKQYPILNWQIQNDNREFVARGFLVPILNNLKSFDQKKIMSISAYKQSLIKAADKKGINAKDLKGAFEAVDKRGNSTKIPLNVRTIKYNSKDAYFITYKYIYDYMPYKIMPWYIKRKMPLDYYFMSAIVEKGSNKLLLIN
ncbi:MAG: hypothetical protein ACYC2T_08990 [Bacillota bacterium]